MISVTVDEATIFNDQIRRFSICFHPIWLWKVWRTPIGQWKNVISSIGALSQRRSSSSSWFAWSSSRSFALSFPLDYLAGSATKWLGPHLSIHLFGNWYFHSESLTFQILRQGTTKEWRLSGFHLKLPHSSLVPWLLFHNLVGEPEPVRFKGFQWNCGNMFLEFWYMCHELHVGSDEGEREGEGPRKSSWDPSKPPHFVELVQILLLLAYWTPSTNQATNHHHYSMQCGGPNIEWNQKRLMIPEWNWVFPFRLFVSFRSFYFLFPSYMFVRFPRLFPPFCGFFLTHHREAVWATGESPLVWVREWLAEWVGLWDCMFLNGSCEPQFQSGSWSQGPGGRCWAIPR